MDRFASQLWAWIAVFAQVFLGGTPVAFALSPNCEASPCCVGSEEDASCCEASEPLTNEAPCCECCADDSSAPETPAPADASRDAVKHWAMMTHISEAILGTVQSDVPTVGERPDAPAPRSLRGFLESRLRV